MTKKNSNSSHRRPTPASSAQHHMSGTVQQAIADLQANADTLRTLLKSINQAQASDTNLETLQQAAGGVQGLISTTFLHTDADRGIDLPTIETRRRVFGENALPASPRKTFWQLFVDTFDDATLQILIVAAVVSLAIGLYDDPAAGYVEGCAILAAVLLVSVVTAANDFQKESQFRELAQAHDESIDVVVIRGGSHWQIPVEELVVGDLVCVEAGDQIPCDGVLLRSDALQIDESALTGEPIDVDKCVNLDPFVLSGCTVEGGSATFVAIAVGKDSQWGIIKSKLEKEQEQTPLQEKLDDMAALIGYVGMAAALSTFLAMMFIKIVIKPAYLADITIFNHALEAFIIGVTVVVVAVPEGLPLAVTISLAFSTKKMLADQNLIRHLAACETMGNATNICSDKTGTLTENRMTVVKGIFADTRCDDTVHRVPILIHKQALEVILEGISCCSTARIHVPDADEGSVTGYGDDDMSTSGQSMSMLQASSSQDEKDNKPRPQVIGNKTEGALLILAQSSWTPNDNTEKRRAEARFGKEGGSRLFPFNSKRKRMTVLVQKERYNCDWPGTTQPSASSSPHKNAKPVWTLYQKGAAEVVLADCAFYLDIDGTEKPMTDRKRAEFESTITEFASETLRCVALCHRHNIEKFVGDPATVSAEECERKLERDLCLDAIVGIVDPLRPDVVEAVATCQKAGIFVRMVTGDNLETAVAIARQAGILTEGTYVRV
jgi:P-type Ca2+ transporter type 2C